MEKILINKVNGYSFKDFDTVGISHKTLYRLKDECKTEREFIDKIITYKYGSSGNVTERLIDHYVPKVIKIKKYSRNLKLQKLKDIKTDLYTTGRLLDIKDKVLDRAWEYTASIYLN